MRCDVRYTGMCIIVYALLCAGEFEHAYYDSVRPRNVVRILSVSLPRQQQPSPPWQTQTEAASHLLSSFASHPFTYQKPSGGDCHIGRRYAGHSSITIAIVIPPCSARSGAAGAGAAAEGGQRREEEEE